ncbi:hypothetical protein DAEQUDRAFT_728030 [Daedalea quercina L-15889]|uniref:Uncharacterized protein n=1 Tax=Daedalea quercina L-15889 TaxID=1314783 RepID=A0A165PHP3_9APHY|nr:hypothetical protein DAEQUDRAFT_728030 [Daedalea quercina L-15889]
MCPPSPLLWTAQLSEASLIIIIIIIPGRRRCRDVAVHEMIRFPPVYHRHRARLPPTQTEALCPGTSARSPGAPEPVLQRTLSHWTRSHPRDSNPQTAAPVRTQATPSPGAPSAPPSACLPRPRPQAHHGARRRTPTRAHSRHGPPHGESDQHPGASANTCVRPSTQPPGGWRPERSDPLYMSGLWTRRCAVCGARRPPPPSSEPILSRDPPRLRLRRSRTHAAALSPAPLWAEGSESEAPALLLSSLGSPRATACVSRLAHTSGSGIPLPPFLAAATLLPGRRQHDCEAARKKKTTPRQTYAGAHHRDVLHSRPLPGPASSGDRDGDVRDSRRPRAGRARAPQVHTRVHRTHPRRVLGWRMPVRLGLWARRRRRSPRLGGGPRPISK